MMYSFDLLPICSHTGLVNEKLWWDQTVAYRLTIETALNSKILLITMKPVSHPTSPGRWLQAQTTSRHARCTPFHDECPSAEWLTQVMQNWIKLQINMSEA
jgi:hypothetical protein